VKTWILVSSGYAARLFETHNAKDPWQELDTWVNPQDRLRRQDLVTDRPGRIAGQANAQRTAYTAPTDPKDQVEAEFASTLVDTLVRALDDGKFNRLVLVAPPRFMGLLRKSEPKRLSGMVFREILKDLTHETTPEIQRHIGPLN
jgi:protein required for attachment to host cells